MKYMGIFKQAISGKQRIAIIAEVKRRSPSHGKFPAHSIPELLTAYERGGASAISVVTEPNMFGGSLELLRSVRASTRLPILRKDFLSKRSDIEQSAQAGANAVLLITSLLTHREIRELAAEAQSFGMDAVLEIHTEQDLAKIVDMRDSIIGINNRNLQTLQTDVRYAEKFILRLPPSRTIIVESAFQHPTELEPYRGRADAALIGTSLLTAANPQSAVASFASSL